MGTELHIDGITSYHVIGQSACTEAQFEVLSACLLGGDDANRAFNQSITFHIKGYLDKDAFESALHQIISRNEAFRMVFDLSQNRFLVLDQMPSEIEFNEAQGNVNSLEEIKVKHAQHCFDLRKGPLYLCSVFSPNPLQHHIVFTAHHVVCDGWTLGLLIQELSSLYNSYSQKNVDALPSAQSFLDYAKYEESLITSETYKSDLEYWRNLFANYKPHSGLSYENPRAKIFTYNSSNISYPLSQTLFADIRELGKKQESSVLITMVSIFEILLYRMSHQSSFVIGIPTAGQNTRGFDQLMGHCVNMLPILSKVDGTISFAEYVKQRKQAYTEAFSHRHITFGTLLKSLKLKREASATPFVPVSFNIDRPLGDALDFEGAESSLEINKRAYSSLEMIMNLARVGDNLCIECAYHEALFTHSSVKRMLDQYAYLLEQICQNPTLKIDDYPLFDKLELLSKYAEFNRTSATLPNHTNLVSWFEETVLKSPDAIALVFENQEFTYSDLNAKINRLAHYLAAKGAGPNQFVAVALNRGLDMLLSLLAILKTGAAYIPIDPEFPAERIQYILQDAKAGFIITSKDFNLDVSAQLIVLEQLEDEITNCSSENLVVHIEAESNVYLIYTSGTTGNPKGVLLKHSNLINLLNSVQKKPGFNAQDSLLAITTVSFDIAGLELYLPLVSGGKLVIASNGVSKDADGLIKELEAHKITVFQATPSTYKMLLANQWPGNKNLKLLCGGEALSLDLAKSLLPKCESLWNMYGPTETCIWSLLKQIKETDKSIEIGKPIDNTEVYVLDENMQIQPFGVHGEICIAGAGLADSYYKRLELTKEKFIQHPIYTDKRIYRTGDLGHITDTGSVICLGRNDNQIKLRGYRIEIEEIEHVLLYNKVEIKESLVLLSPWKNNDHRLLALLVPNEAYAIQFQKHNDLNLAFLTEVEELKYRSIASNSLPEYMVPSNYLYIENLPLTPNGKIDRKRLMDLDFQHFFQSKLKNQAKDVSNNKESVWSENELVLKQIWEDTLGIQDAKVNDDFFASGGHSLLAIEMMFKIEKHFKVKLPLSSLFANSNIASLASLLETGSKYEWKYLVPVKANGSKPPLYIVHGLGLEVMVFKDIAKYIGDDQPVIGVQAMGLTGKEEPLNTIKEISQVYLQEIIAHNPDGPYHIAGFSAGFIIAYEMAQQLKAKGKIVASLVNFDFAFETVVHQTQVKRSLLKKVSEFIPRQKHVIKTFMKFPGIEWKYQKTYFGLSVEGILRRLGFKIDDGDPASLNEMFRIIDLYRFALSTYQFKAYEGDMEILVSQIKTYYLKDPIHLGWIPLVNGKVYTYPVDGQHDDMIIGEYAEGFSNALQIILDQNNLKFLN